MSDTFPCPGNGTSIDTGTGNPANDVCLAAIFDPPASWQSFTWVMDSSCAAYGWTAENPADNTWFPSFAISVPSIPWSNNSTAIILNLSSVTNAQGATTLTVKCSATNLNPK